MRWIIKQEGDAFDLSYGRKTHLRDATEIQVRKYLKKSLKPGEKVFLIEEDGYKFDVTRRYNRLVR